MVDQNRTTVRDAQDHSHMTSMTFAHSWSFSPLPVLCTLLVSIISCVSPQNFQTSSKHLVLVYCHPGTLQALHMNGPLRSKAKNGKTRALKHMRHLATCTTLLLVLRNCAGVPVSGECNFCVVALVDLATRYGLQLGIN